MPRIIDYYNLDKLVVDGCHINRAWYGLKQGGKIAHDDIVNHLKKHGYVLAGVTDGLFKQVTCDISFTLLVDNFGIKYTREEDVRHLIKIMRKKYSFKVDFNSKQYIGIHLDWDYDKRELKCSMKVYVEQALTELEHVLTNKCHFLAPSKGSIPNQWAKIQYATNDDSNPLDEKTIRYLQCVVGKFLCYARTINNTMLHAINDISSSVSNGTTTTMKAVQYFMDYATSNPDAKIIYRSSVI